MNRAAEYQKGPHAGPFVVGAAPSSRRRRFCLKAGARWATRTVLAGTPGFEAGSAFASRNSIRPQRPPEEITGRIMKVRNSVKSLRSRHRDNKLVRRKGRIYVINKTQKRFKARQG